MSLRQTLRSGVAAICIAGAAMPAGAVPHVQPRGPLDVRVAQARDFSRLEFHWAGGAKVATRRAGQTLILTFSRDADPDIARLRTSPPKWLKTAEKRHVGGKLELVLTLAEDADAKVGTDEGATFVNVFEKVETAPELAAATVAPPAPAEPDPVRPNPMPAGGVVRMEAKTTGGQTQLSFPWANPAGAAVFRRGDAVWIVFDSPAAIDISKAPRGTPQLRTLQAYRGADYSALRIETGDDTPLFTASEGSVWTVTLGAGAQARPALVRISRDPAAGAAALKAPVAGATRVVRLPDPMVGDTLSVVTALGPAKGIPDRRDYVQMAILSSSQGLAVESHIDDLEVSRDGDIVQIGRPKGLALSPAWASKERAQATMGAPMPAAMPGLVDAENWAQTGEDGFLRRYNALVTAATAESGDSDRGGPVEAQMALARFLVGSELSFEAIGVLNAAGRAHPELMDNAEFRGLRGVARVMARRYKEAEADFASPVLSDDPSSALWRSYIAYEQAHWPEARTEFARGAPAYAQFPALWRARFARAEAQAALAMGDLNGAEISVKMALADRVDPVEELATRLVQAKVIEAQGQKERALRIFAAVARAPVESVSAPALLRATQIRLETGKINANQAAEVFDGLRYRWRGDSTELLTIRALGQLYLSQGRYREALEALRSAGMRLPDLPEALQLQTDLATAFRTLFLDGMADGLEPIQALALFYDFKELTPIGADGDLMVRKLVRRLVDVDLLNQAGDLLKYQAENRLDGAARAQVATDLAVIYLMDRKPEQAIQAINTSRSTVLPAALSAERRLIEARAWAQLGRFDGALEIIERDPTREAQDLRAEISWKQKNWAVAGPQFEKALGARYKNTEPLTAEEEGKLLRAGVAYSLAGDDAALGRLNQQYEGFYEGAQNPDALRVALSGVPSGRLGVADFARVSADNAAFSGWVAKMKARFKTKPGPVGGAKAVQAPGAAKTAEAAPVKAAAKG